jgi:hypothetical protein
VRVRHIYIYIYTVRERKRKGGRERYSESKTTIYTDRKTERGRKREIQ